MTCCCHSTEAFPVLQSQGLKVSHFWESMARISRNCGKIQQFEGLVLGMQLDLRWWH